MLLLQRRQHVFPSVTLCQDVVFQDGCDALSALHDAAAVMWVMMWCVKCLGQWDEVIYQTTASRKHRRCSLPPSSILPAHSTVAAAAEGGTWHTNIVTVSRVLVCALRVGNTCI